MANESPHETDGLKASGEGVASGEGAMPAGHLFGKYVLQVRLAVGGMGEIYLARERRGKPEATPVVIKRILDRHLDNAIVVGRFLEEARLMSQLRHPNIVCVCERGQIDGHFYMAMELVRGKSLREVIRRARSQGEFVPPALVAEIVAQAARGLAYAHGTLDEADHGSPVVHRDVCPDNLLVGYDGQVKIIDFGIARPVDDESSSSGAHPHREGRLAYMSPEQIDGLPVDGRADQFALGICLYETLALRNPFARQDESACLDAIKTWEPTPIYEIHPRLGPFQPLLVRALAKRPAERFASCDDLGQALLALRDELAPAGSAPALDAYMHDLFDEHIAHERRWLGETTEPGPAERPLALWSTPSTQTLRRQAGYGRSEGVRSVARGLLVVAFLLLAGSVGAGLYSGRLQQLLFPDPLANLKEVEAPLVGEADSGPADRLARFGLLAIEASAPLRIVQEGSVFSSPMGLRTSAGAIVLQSEMLPPVTLRFAVTDRGLAIDLLGDASLGVLRARESHPRPLPAHLVLGEEPVAIDIVRRRDRLRLGLSYAPEVP